MMQRVAIISARDEIDEVTVQAANIFQSYPDISDASSGIRP